MVLTCLQREKKKEQPAGKSLCCSESGGGRGKEEVLGGYSLHLSPQASFAYHSFPASSFNGCPSTLAENHCCMVIDYCQPKNNLYIRLVEVWVSANKTPELQPHPTPQLQARVIYTGYNHLGANGTTTLSHASFQQSLVSLSRIRPIVCIQTHPTVSRSSLLKECF